MNQHRHTASASISAAAAVDCAAGKINRAAAAQRRESNLVEDKEVTNRNRNSNAQLLENFGRHFRYIHNRNIVIQNIYIYSRFWLNDNDSIYRGLKFNKV